MILCLSIIAVISMHMQRLFPQNQLDHLEFQSLLFLVHFFLALKILYHPWSIKHQLKYRTMSKKEWDLFYWLSTYLMKCFVQARDEYWIHVDISKQRGQDFLILNAPILHSFITIVRVSYYFIFMIEQLCRYIWQTLILLFYFLMLNARTWSDPPYTVFEQALEYFSNTRNRLLLIFSSS